MISRLYHLVGSRRIPLAMAMFLAGFTLGTIRGGEIGGLQVRADTTAVTPSVAVSPQSAFGTHPAEVLRVLDGDTFEARMPVWPGIEITSKVRLRGIDAPELKARCPDERNKAEAAREALRALLAEGGVAVTHIGLDKYGGRVLADAATRSTANVSASLLANGLVRVYGGGRRETWCNGT